MIKVRAQISAINKKSYKRTMILINYQVEHWEEAMVMLFATNDWQALDFDDLFVESCFFFFEQ